MADILAVLISSPSHTHSQTWVLSGSNWTRPYTRAARSGKCSHQLLVCFCFACYNSMSDVAMYVRMCMSPSRPMLVLAGGCDQDQIGMGAFQEWSQVNTTL